MKNFFVQQIIYEKFLKKREIILDNFIVYFT